MKLFILIVWAASLVEGYRILCVFPVPSASHNILGKGIVDALLGAGHQVWWATPYPEELKQPVAHLTLIDVSGTKVVFERNNMSDPVSVFLATPFMGPEIASIAASTPEMFRIMRNENFDAVITEWFASDLPAGYAAVQQVPWIMLSSFAAHSYLEMLVDDVISTALMPSILIESPLPMNFWQRMANSLVVEAMKIGTWATRVYASRQYMDLFGPLAAARGTVLPPLSEVYNNVSILLVNSHPSLAPARSFPPNVVDIGGYHVQENDSLPQVQNMTDLSSSSSSCLSESEQELTPIPSTSRAQPPLPQPLPQTKQPTKRKCEHGKGTSKTKRHRHDDYGESIRLLSEQDLKELLDSSTQGFVYFSMGSLVKMSDLSDSLKKELAQMFGELSYTVLWKSNEELKDLPSNVHVRKWFPQAGILAHRNIKLFITHSGLLSVTEAVHYGVPLLAVPVFGDQPGNAQRAVDAGFAVRVNFHPGMASELRSGLTEMVNNERYYNTAKYLSKLYHKRPVPPAKLIPHYVELAIESRGAYHLRSAARHYPWFARARIDQLLFCAGFFYSLYVAGRVVARQLRRSKRKTE